MSGVRAFDSAGDTFDSLRAGSAASNTADPKMSSSHSTHSALQAILLPYINKDLPTLYALEFQNTALGPGIVLQFLSHFIFIFSIED
jgi:hypothetical protein